MPDPFILSLSMFILGTAMVLLLAFFCSKSSCFCSQSSLQNSSFSGMKNNKLLSKAIQESFVNQKVTLGKTVENEMDPIVYLCLSCNMVMVEVESNCQFCGGNVIEKI